MPSTDSAPRIPFAFELFFNFNQSEGKTEYRYVEPFFLPSHSYLASSVRTNML